MYISRITLHDRARQTSDFWHVFQSSYTVHQSIWRLFSDHNDRRRDFLYRLEQSKGRPLVYTVSEREPDRKQDFWFVETKRYEPKISKGLHLAFLLRANPIRSKRDAEDKQHRHDVIMEAKTRLRGQDDKKPLATLTQEEGSNWLSSRAERFGFKFFPQQVRVDGYQQHRFFKRKDGRQICLSTVELSGMLTVTDPQLFLEALYKGVGPAKAFGCGLMLVRRI
jgi:CRISPR system Cascade subunit CasE